MVEIKDVMKALERWAPDSLTTVKYLGNTPLEWISAGVLAVVVALTVRVFKAFLVKRLRKLAAKSTTRADDIVVETLDATHVFFYLAVGLYLGTQVLDAKASIRHGLDVAIIIALLIQGGLWTQALFSRSADRWSEKRGGNESSTVAAGVKFVARLTIWVVVLLMVLANVGVEISAVIAGLGIGGVAAALALQSILGDVFASLSMYFDRPFDIGDFIIVDDFKGNVEGIGIRTTRVKSLDGEQIVFPNGDLVKSRIRNYGRMLERRIAFGFGIEYNLAYEKVASAAQIAAEIVQGVEGVRFDRAHFKGYGAYSLDYEVVYYVLSPEYVEYMNKQQEINLQLYRRFEEEGIPFAFPTRTIYHRDETPSESGDSQRPDESRRSGSRRAGGTARS
ncbi:MAG TPA: mechanosensitive ion channel family protein [Polyangiaceae bacterium]